MRAPRDRPGDGRDGFILVEALAALALGALILAALMSFTALLRRSADNAAARVQRLEITDRTVLTIAGEIRQASRLRFAADPAERAAAGAEGGGAPAGQAPRTEDAGSGASASARTPSPQAPPAEGQGAEGQGTGGQGTESQGAERQLRRAFVFSGAPDRVIFALTPLQATGLRAAVMVAWQVDEAGGLLRAEGPLPVTATGPEAVRLGPVARVDPGPERLRFAFVDRRPGGAETITDGWSDPTRMPAAVRIDRADRLSGAVIGSVRVPLLIDGEPGCVDPEKGFCSRSEKPQQGKAPTQPEAADAAGEPQ